MKKFKIVWLFWTVPALMVLFLVCCPIVNDMVAASVANEIWETSLPPQSEKIEKESRAGKLTGSGNGMQFFGAVLLRSDCSLDELKTYYASYSKDEWSYVVKVQETNDIDVIEHGRLNFESTLDNGKYFLVYSWGSGVSPFCEFDIRGH